MAYSSSSYGSSSVDPTWSLKEVAKASNGLSLWLPKDVWLPGDVVVGKLKADLKQRTTIRAVRVKLHGEVRVHWHTGSGKNRHDYSKTVELFPDQLVTVHGSEKVESGPMLHLEASHPYEWSFKFTLPPKLPGSVSLRDGTFITYTLTGYCDIPNWPDYHVVLGIDVAPSHVALADIPSDIKQPIDRKDVTPVFSCCCCCARGNAVISVSTSDRIVSFDEAKGTATVPHITAGIENMSDRGLEGVKLSLMGEVSMTNGYRSHGYYFTVAELEVAPSLAAGQSIPPKPITFPPLKVARAFWVDEAARGILQQPTISAGGILWINYKLVLRADNGCCNADPETVVPIYVAPVGSGQVGTGAAVVEEEEAVQLPASMQAYATEVIMPGSGYKMTPSYA